MLERVPAVLYVLAAHSVVAVVLIISGTVLVGIHAINSDTLLAMASGAVGLLSGGGTALALQHSLRAEARMAGRRRTDA